MDWSSFVPNLLATLIGLGGALWFDRMRRLQTKRDADEARDRLKEKRLAGFSRNALWGIEENQELARQIEAEIERADPRLPNLAFRMNTHILNEAVLEMARLSDDPTLLWELEHFRFQLTHLNGKLDIIAKFGPKSQSASIAEWARSSCEAIIKAGNKLTQPLKAIIQRFDPRSMSLPKPSFAIDTDESD